MKITEIKSNPNNPRLIKDHKFKQLVKSIQDFPQMLELRPIVIDENNMVLGGNMRLKACLEAGLTDVPVIHANNLSEEKKKEFIVKDNVGYGEWDWDILANEWDTELITAWGLDIPNWGNIDKLSQVNSTDTEWIGMPEFESKEDSLKIIIHFEFEANRDEFANKNELEFISKQQKTWSTTYPFKEKQDLSSLKYE